MDKFIIRGGRRLSGSVTISGAKNASLALMPAALLASGTFRLTNTPELRDVATMSSLLQTMGMQISLNDHVLTMDTRGVNKYEAPYEHVKKMRASIYVLGPLVGRYGRAKVSLPGGCAWGPRPVNLHIEGLRKLGAAIEIEHGYIVARAPKLRGATIHFDISSVGATGNVMMAAVLAKGTVLHLMVEGLVNPGVIPVREKRIGRPNASFLWIAVAAISQSGDITRLKLKNTVHFSGFTIEEWLKTSVQNGWLVASSSIRDRRYRVTSNGIKSLAEFVEAKWIEWRLGKYPDRHGSPLKRYFVSRGSHDMYQKLAANLRQPFILSGISVLEKRSNLVASTSIREMAFITTKEAAGAMVAEGKMELSEIREVPGASELTILDIKHPIFGIYAQRLESSGDGWPLGLAALDCIDHPNARVSMLAKDLWRKWIDEIQTTQLEIFNSNDMGRRTDSGDDR